MAPPLFPFVFQVTCNDTTRLIETITELRGKTKEELMYAKLGIDGGRGSIKIELSLLYKVNSMIRQRISIVTNSKISLRAANSWLDCWPAGL
jgi:hypothetical protein